MRQFLLSFFALSWISACVGCGKGPNSLAPRRELAAELVDDTVALVRLVDAEGNDDPDGHPRLYCAGVWVAPRKILTASHCVADLGKPDEREFLESVGVPLPPWDPVGQPVKFSRLSDWPSSYWTGRVASFDRSVDLALVSVDWPAPMHSYARVSTAAISAGDPVEVVGHPAGNAWSYAEGFVSAQRPDQKNADRNPMPTLQVQAPISRGNSGSGAFDDSGQLIGIVSYIQEPTNGMGFFVHRDAIIAFLRGAS